MAITYRQQGVSDLMLKSDQKLGAVNQALSVVYKSSDTIINNEGWQGASADSVKMYMEDVYPAVLGSFSLAIQELNAAVKYYVEDYRGIEHASDAVISESELQSIENRLDRYIRSMSGISGDVSRSLHRVADIGQIPYSGITSLENQTADLVRRLRELRETVSKIEGDAQSRIAGIVISLITDTLNLIKAQKKTDIGAYSRAELVQSPEYQQLAKSYEVAAQDIEANTERIERAQQAANELVEQLQEEYEERQRKAGIVKFLVGAACVVASVAVTVATAGMAAPVIAAATIATGVVTGAASAGIGSIMDQQIGTLAGPGKIDWGRAALDSAVGGVIGGVTSAIGLKFDAVSQGIKGSGALDVTKRILIGGAKKTAQGFATDTIQGTYDAAMSGGSVIEGMTSGFDLRKRVADFGSGCASTGVKEGMKAIEKKNNWFTGEKKSENRDFKYKGQRTVNEMTLGDRAVKSAFHGGVETIAGSAGNFTSELINTGNMRSAVDKALDLETNLTTFAAAAGGEMAAETVEYRREKQALAKYDEQLDQIQKESDEYIANKNKNNQKKYDDWAKKGIGHTENGCPDYHDSPELVAEVKMEGTYSNNPDKSADYNKNTLSRKEDYFNAFEKMDLPPNEYEIQNNGHVIRKDPVTGKKIGDYTMHHVADYNVRDGSFTMQLVPTDLHDASGYHAGGNGQLDYAYRQKDAAAVIDARNQARKEYLKDRPTTNSGVDLPSGSRKAGTDAKKQNDKLFPERSDENAAGEDETVSANIPRYRFRTQADL